jgi:hypothetical protein
VRPIDKVILESKCQKGYPRWLTEALRNILPQRISKFTTSMNLLATDGTEAAGAPAAFSGNHDGEGTPADMLPLPRRELPPADGADNHRRDERTGQDETQTSRLPGGFGRSEAGHRNRGGASD